MNNVVLGVGSNIDPERNIARVQELLAERFRVLGASRWTRTKPVGNPAQPDFINGAIRLQTGLDQPRLQGALKDIEHRMGRVATNDRFGPRIIDLDIVVWNDRIVDPDFYARDFLRAAVLELMPYLEKREKAEGSAS